MTDVASQRITIAKLGGVAAESALLQLRDWSAARQTADPEEWSSEQWPADVRSRADAFADRLRSQSLIPPVIHFVEWVDLWSMGDLFGRWLTPPGGPGPFVIHADRYELYGYALPDDGRLGEHLSRAGSRQIDESKWFVTRLNEAVGAWRKVVDGSAILVLREVVGGLVTDEGILGSLDLMPGWLSAQE